MEQLSDNIMNILTMYRQASFHKPINKLVQESIIGLKFGSSTFLIAHKWLENPTPNRALIHGIEVNA